MHIFWLSDTINNNTKAPVPRGRLRCFSFLAIGQRCVSQFSYFASTHRVIRRLPRFDEFFQKKSLRLARALAQPQHRRDDEPSTWSHWRRFGDGFRNKTRSFPAHRRSSFAFAFSSRRWFRRFADHDTIATHWKADRTASCTSSTTTTTTGESLTHTRRRRYRRYPRYLRRR